MANELKSKLWVFLNSNFGLFLMSSVVLSFITWSYTQWMDALEKEKALSEQSTKLNTEISYRVQVIHNYFESECSDPQNLSIDTFMDIEEIYSASSSYKAIFPENNDKELHTLIWEMSAIQKENVKQQYIDCFNSLLQFNAYLNRLLNQMDTQGQFYGQPVDYEMEVNVLKETFSAALNKIENAPLLTKAPPPN